MAVMAPMTGRRGNSTSALPTSYGTKPPITVEPVTYSLPLRLVDVAMERFGNLGLHPASAFSRYYNCLHQFREIVSPLIRLIANVAVANYKQQEHSSSGNHSTHKRKYNPQLLAPPTRLGTKPRYRPDGPSVLTASASARYTAVPNGGFGGGFKADVEPCKGLGVESVDADVDPKREAGGRNEEPEDDPSDPVAELELPALRGTPPVGRVDVVAS